MDYDKIIEAMEAAPLTWIPAIMVKAVDIAIKRGVFASNEALQKVVGRVVDNNQSELVDPYWQPIGTAPRDGTRILLLENGEVHAAAWKNCSMGDEYGWLIGVTVTDWNDYLQVDSPTHWAPSPQLPKETK